MSKKISFVLIFAAAIFAQELPQTQVQVQESHTKGFYKANIDSLYIRWSHHAKADTFWVYKANQSLEFIINSNMRTVWYNQPQKYERRMATHHLREYILNSPLKFNHLDELAKGKNPKVLNKNLKEYFNKVD